MAARAPHSNKTSLKASGVNLDDVKPFLSAVLLEALKLDRPLANALIREAKSAISNTTGCTCWMAPALTNVAIFM